MTPSPVAAAAETDAPQQLHTLAPLRPVSIMALTVRQIEQLEDMLGAPMASWSEDVSQIRLYRCALVVDGQRTAEQSLDIRLDELLALVELDAAADESGK